MKDVKQPRALETREKILQAAARLFALKGYHDAKLEEVLEIELGQVQQRVLETAKGQFLFSPANQRLAANMATSTMG